VRRRPTRRHLDAIAILVGVLAGSVALIGFGLDFAIEGFASAIIVWRFTGAGMFSEAAEQRAQKLVAIQFFILGRRALDLWLAA
jgi:hypothetical protein